MPAEDMWRTFFNPSEALPALGLRADMRNVVDLGCGYGTFSVPATQLIAGTVHAFDIEPEMVRETKRQAELGGVTNAKVQLRDFIRDGTGLPAASGALTRSRAALDRGRGEAGQQR